MTDVAARWTIAIPGLCILAAVFAGCEEEPGNRGAAETGRAQPPLPTATITIDGVALEVEVADEPNERARGYMWRDPPVDGGMLFVWPDASRRAFYMKNTPFDIDLAYIAPDGRIFQVERMRAYDRRLVPSRKPAQYVLETAAGWFADHGISEGDTARIPPQLASNATAEDGP